MEAEQTIAQKLRALQAEMEAKNAQYFELTRQAVEDAFSKHVAPICAAFEGKCKRGYSLVVDQNSHMRAIVLEFSVIEHGGRGAAVHKTNGCVEPGSGSFYRCYKVLTPKTIKKNILLQEAPDLMIRTKLGSDSTPELIERVKKMIQGMNQVQRVIDELGMTTLKVDPLKDFNHWVNV